MSLLTLGLSLLGMVACWLLVFIPIVGGLLSAVALPLVQMFFAGTGFCDPALGRRRFAVGASLRFALHHRWRVVGHGCGFVMLLAIPFIGWFIAPSYGLMAGTLGAAELLHPAKSTKPVPPPL
jgi:CysZ protein